MSLLPLSTAWMAVSRLSPQPVAFYAAVFFLVNATYALLIWQLVEPSAKEQSSVSLRRNMRVRSIATLCLFATAAIVALRFPLVGLGDLLLLPGRLLEAGGAHHRAGCRRHRR